MRLNSSVGSRHDDWLRQADADLRHARNAFASEDYEWSCFAAQQAAEKAIKAAFLASGREAWGHTLTILLGRFDEIAGVPEELVDAARVLDKHYIPTRYPNGFDDGAPTDFYTRDEAEAAVTRSGEIIEFCRRQIH
jgi:HEPN domain-containing protein